MSAFITSIGTANPKHKISQQEVLRFMQRAHQLDEQQLHELTVLYRATGIQTRHSVIEDYKLNDNRSFFSNGFTHAPSTKQRNEVFKKEALSLSLESALQCLSGSPCSASDITHLITVSCTGLYAPGLDIELIQKLGLSSQVERTGINFMGCYAAFNAMKVARAICTSEQANVLIVCTELCSIHFQPDETEDVKLANSLFGDGSAAVLVQSDHSGNPVLEMNHFACDLLPNGKNDMAWDIGDTGFEMKLSTYVPDVIKTGITYLVNRMKQEMENYSPDYYAIHPGGKKILKVIENELAISRENNRFAHDVLKNYGNMSSPTVLFVLKEIMQTLQATDNNKQILGMAFGPGLTLESMLLTIYHNGQ